MLSAKLLLFIGAARAFPWDGVKPTGKLNLNLVPYLAEPPQPTAAPILRERQAAGDVYCGWENGKGSSTFGEYCESQAVCATNELAAWGCCLSQSLDDCALYTTCIDSTAASQLASSYGSNAFAETCTLSQKPNCISQIIELNPPVTGYYCGSSGADRTETYYSTYWNASAAKTILPVTYYNAAFDSYTTPVLISSTHSSSTSTSTSSTTTTVASSSVSPTPTPTPASDSGSSTPVGAIVGGTVGGVAVLAGLALLAFFLIRRNRRDPNQSPHTPVQPLPPPQSPPTTQYAHPQSPPQPYGFSPQPQPQQPYQPNTGFYPEKGATQNTAPIHGTPETSYPSPTSTVPDRMSNVPQYQPPYETPHELGV